MLARAALNEVIPPPELGARLDDVRLAIGELVTNATMHAGLHPEQDVVRLTIEADDDRVRAEVEQSTSALGVRPVAPRWDDVDRVGGFGLRIVEATADEWGVDPGPPGHVWVEFRR